MTAMHPSSFEPDAVAADPLGVDPIVLLDDDAGALAAGRPAGTAAASDVVDPGLVMLTCANCGARMDERKCRLICRCGYFLSCSDYY